MFNSQDRRSNVSRCWRSVPTCPVTRTRPTSCALHHEHPREDHRRRRSSGSGAVRLRFVRRVRPGTARRRSVPRPRPDRPRPLERVATWDDSGTTERRRICPGCVPHSTSRSGTWCPAHRRPLHEPSLRDRPPSRRLPAYASLPTLASPPRTRRTWRDTWPRATRPSRSTRGRRGARPRCDPRRARGGRGRCGAHLRCRRVLRSSDGGTDDAGARRPGRPLVRGAGPRPGPGGIPAADAARRRRDRARRRRDLG